MRSVLKGGNQIQGGRIFFFRIFEHFGYLHLPSSTYIYLLNDEVSIMYCPSILECIVGGAEQQVTAELVTSKLVTPGLIAEKSVHLEVWTPLFTQILSLRGMGTAYARMLSTGHVLN